MSTEQLAHNVDSIGTVAGLVWNYLSASGPVPRDLVMQAVGWLAREDKILFHEGKRSKTVALRT